MELQPPPFLSLPPSLLRVAQYSGQNLMKASNLGVVFGPSLMRPERECVATIVDIKYQNIVVEEMIESMDKVQTNDPSPSPSLALALAFP